MYWLAVLDLPRFNDCVTAKAVVEKHIESWDFHPEVQLAPGGQCKLYIRAAQDYTTRTMFRRMYAITSLLAAYYEGNVTWTECVEGDLRAGIELGTMQQVDQCYREYWLDVLTTEDRANYVLLPEGTCDLYEAANVLRGHSKNNETSAPKGPPCQK